MHGLKILFTNNTSSFMQCTYTYVIQYVIVTFVMEYRFQCSFLYHFNSIIQRTCERISKSSTNDKEDHREKAEVVRTCKAKERGRIVYATVQGMGRRGRQKPGGKTRISVGLKEEGVLDKTTRKNDIHNHSGVPR